MCGNSASFQETSVVAPGPEWEVRSHRIWDRWLYRLVLAEFLTSPVLTLVQDVYRIEAGGLSLLQLARGSLLGAILVCLVQVSIPARRNLRFFAPILLLAFYSAILTPFAAMPKSNAIASFRMAYPCLVGVAAYVVISRGFLGERGLRRVAWYWLLTYFGSQLVALRSGQTAYESQYAAAGLGTSASAADGLILLVPFFLLAGRWRVRDLTGLAIALLAASLTMRRTAMLGVSAAALAGAAARALRRGSGLRASLAAAMLAGGILVGFAYGLTATEWGTDFSRRLEDMDPRQGGTGAGRTTIWQGGVSHLLKRGALRNVCGEGEGAYAEAMIERIGFSVAAHNGWLTLLVAYGAVGAALYLSFVWRLAVLTARARHRRDSTFEVLGAVLVGIVCSEVTQGFLLSPSAVPTYVMMAFVVARYYGLAEPLAERVLC